MDGLLIIDKPSGMTSHDVVSRVRRILSTKKVGHTGTLDPFATGVMVVLVGKATRLARFLDKDKKEYVAVLKLGEKTDTGDLTGNVIKTERIASALEIGEVLVKFRGKQKQIPPMYSAKKIDGKKLYELARQGVEIRREPIDIKIFELEMVNAEPCTIRVAASAGTFIRTLAEDIAEAAGSTAHLTELRRTKAGRFLLEDSVTLDALSESEVPAIHLISLEVAVSGLKNVTLKNDRVQKTKNGLATRISGSDFADGEFVSIFDEEKNLIAIGVYDKALGEIKPKVVL